MRVVHILAGAGGNFDCPNCRRDRALLSAIGSQGIESLPVILYLPLLNERADFKIEPPVFFGALNVYLQEKNVLFRKTPRQIDRIFDAPKILRWISGFSSPTSAHGLEELTLSMLLGEAGRQTKELKRLINWLKEIAKPDLVHISNALLLGLAKSIKEQVGVPVVCSLQDEDVWINSMRIPYQQKVWEVMAAQANYVDAFIAVSHYFADYMRHKLFLPAEKVDVIPVGLDFDLYQQTTLSFDPPILGYFSPLATPYGLERFIAAFISLKQDPRFKNLKFKAAGWGVGDDKAVIKRMKKKLSVAGLTDQGEFMGGLNRQEQIAFIGSLTVMSCPAVRAEAFGIFLIEAMAQGIPIVQTEIGAFPEILKSGGGCLVGPQDDIGLVRVLGDLLSDADKARTVGQQGREQALSRYTAKKVASEVALIYNNCLK